MKFLPVCIPCHSIKILTDHEAKYTSMYFEKQPQMDKKDVFLSPVVCINCFASSVSGVKNVPVKRGFKTWGFVPCVVPVGLFGEMVSQWDCHLLCLHHIQAAVVIFALTTGFFSGGSQEGGTPWLLCPYSGPHTAERPPGTTFLSVLVLQGQKCFSQSIITCQIFGNVAVSDLFLNRHV